MRPGRQTAIQLASLHWLSADHQESKWESVSLFQTVAAAVQDHRDLHRLTASAWKIVSQRRPGEFDKETKQTGNDRGYPIRRVLADGRNSRPAARVCLSHFAS